MQSVSDYGTAQAKSGTDLVLASIWIWLLDVIDDEESRRGLPSRRQPQAELFLYGGEDVGPGSLSSCGCIRNKSMLPRRCLVGRKSRVDIKIFLSDRFCRSLGGLIRDRENRKSHQGTSLERLRHRRARNEIIDLRIFARVEVQVLVASTAWRATSSLDRFNLRPYQGAYS